jgi:Domain of unknown function (DUF4293)
MIQRIQSLFLILIAMLSGFLLTGSVISFINKTGSVINITFTEVIKSTGGLGIEVIEKLLPLTILIIVIPLISLITIFLYNKRRYQLVMSRVLITLNSILIIAFLHVSLRIISGYGAQLVPGVKMIIPILMLILAILAFRGIKKDDQLVKSYDRLR